MIAINAREKTTYNTKAWRGSRRRTATALCKFKSTCSDSCINKADVLLEVALPSRVKPDSIILNNVTMVDDDEKEFGIISSIPIIDLAYLSFIGTKKSKKVQTMQRTTAAVIAKKITTRTTTTTTVLTIAPTSTTTTTTGT
ncbi:unnamed protein product [Rotaria magnacalcarata]|uniref:Uncharacterized protein n=1 Tax=Rotaria magnacalcarata TaxID=392030 RepID=A0A820KIJ7_9BILA|nr:unnamed protein product [Rotaria magnacalcarata]CAF4337882.1 unnamed protein product [Rotaria magnacalcarata]